MRLRSAFITVATLWTAGLGDDLSAGVFGNYHSLDFPQWNWSAGAMADQYEAIYARLVGGER